LVEEGIIFSSKLLF